MYPCVQYIRVCYNQDILYNSKNKVQIMDGPTQSVFHYVHNR